MALRILVQYTYGVRFQDRTFFNGVITQEEFELLNGENALYWLGNSIVPRLVSQYSLHLTNGTVVDWQMGGYEIGGHTAEVGKLFQEGGESTAVETSTGMEEQADDNGFEYLWTDATIRLLVATRAELQRKFESPYIKQKKAWDLVARVMSKHGHHVSGVQCDKKYRDLKRTFHANYQRAKKSGAGAVRWPYYDLMAEHLREDPTTEPLALAASLPLPENEENKTSPSSSQNSSIMEESDIETSSQTTPQPTPQPRQRKRRRAILEEAVEATRDDNQAFEDKMTSMMETLITSSNSTLNFLKENFTARQATETKKLELLSNLTSMFGSLSSKSSAATSSAATSSSSIAAGSSSVTIPLNSLLQFMGNGQQQ